MHHQATSTASAGGARTSAGPAPALDPHSPRRGAVLNLTTASGWDLVVAAQRGDRDAFGQLYDRYASLVFGFVLRRVGERRLAEDLTSETFLRALRGIGSVREQGRDVGAWLVTIARNLVLDHVKSNRYRLELLTADIEVGAGGGPEQEVLREATTAELMRCVARLEPGQRECVVLRFVHGLSVAQTAEVMGRREGAVRALQHRAVRKLGQLLPEASR